MELKAFFIRHLHHGNWYQCECDFVFVELVDILSHLTISIIFQPKDQQLAGRIVGLTITDVYGLCSGASICGFTSGFSF
jgi:hypothetical protein